MRDMWKGELFAVRDGIRGHSVVNETRWESECVFKIHCDIIFPFAMVDPDPHTESMKPKVGECICEYCDFIRRALISEMVYDRYFCEPGSREFVELDSVDVEHFERNGNRKNMLYRVTARVKFSGVIHNFPLIIKLPKPQVNFLLANPFLNEEMFYSKMTLNYGADGSPKCYLSDLGRYDRAVIVLEDLTARGYTRVDDKLDEDHLKLCMKALAAFHAKGLKLKAYKFPVFREFYAKLYIPADWLYFHTNIQTDNVSTLEASDNNPEYQDFSLCSALRVETDLFEKIRKKQDVTAHLEIDDFWTICHGNFTRNNLLFKYENGRPCDVKMIDWSTMRYCSPSIDFGHILLQNLPDDNNLLKTEAFCQNILQIYLDTMKDEYPEVNCELLKRDIIAKLPFAYGIIENHMLREARVMLRTLDCLGSFD